MQNLKTMTGVLVELSPADAALFLEFRRLQDTFATMVATGVFNTRNGKAILHFDNEGTLAQIDFDVVGFKRTKLSTG